MLFLPKLAVLLSLLFVLLTVSVASAARPPLPSLGWYYAPWHRIDPLFGAIPNSGPDPTSFRPRGSNGPFDPAASAPLSVPMSPDDAAYGSNDAALLASGAFPSSDAVRGGTYVRGYGLGFYSSARSVTPREFEAATGRDIPDWRGRRIREAMREEQEWRARTGLPLLRVPNIRRLR